MTAVICMIFMCSVGTPHCIQAGRTEYPTPRECFAGIGRQYRGTLHANGRFYVKGLRSEWLRCVGVSPYDGTVVRARVLP